MVTLRPRRDVVVSAVRAVITTSVADAARTKLVEPLVGQPMGHHCRVDVLGETVVAQPAEAGVTAHVVAARTSAHDHVHLV